MNIRGAGTLNESGIILPVDGYLQEVYSNQTLDSAYNSRSEDVDTNKCQHNNVQKLHHTLLNIIII